ncbi:cobalamin biosynthesis protein [Candidatus Nitrosarchaeum limnium]|uniref:Probable cobalamin biosynthesis protein CobD n=1 Tax=Candidatus Nitrosarchaeum limnium BG20 TaxID=859192 RepID=S2ET38_9ARCH|nr:cobalamin biosynthesis protein [Candidatus Nitrosarchaeum limnium]EPA05519.1 cobalamin biosynthesis protein CobD [Candidatus Nitrosarchaeum limnium BG20]
MIFESLLIVFFALALDFTLGDPRNKFHPTSWIGSLIAKLTPYTKNSSEKLEKFGGILIILISCLVVASLIISLNVGIKLITFDYLHLIISIIVGGILLKTTIAVKGMEKHALAVVTALEQNNLSSARDNLSMIVKRNTKNLDKNHVFSGVLESISENTVDGITSPLFYFAFFGLPGAFVFRVINTADSMIGYKTDIFKNVGWFGANCDKILNYIPSRLTGFIMILSSMILGNNWKKSYQIMMRDGRKTQSPNAGYPMAAIAGALEAKFEKLDHYSLGDGSISFTKEHVKSAISIMKVTSILFCGIVVVPIVLLLSYLGWWIHA